MKHQELLRHNRASDSLKKCNPSPLHQNALWRDSISKNLKIAAAVAGVGSVAVGYNQASGLRKLDLRLDADDRIALLGANGEGKSILSKL